MARQERAEMTRHAIVKAAADVFLTTSFGGVSLNSIMSEANVTKGAFYFHFSSKEEVARAVVQEFDSAMESHQELAKGKSPALESMIQHSFMMISKSLEVGRAQGIFRLMLESGVMSLADVNVWQAWIERYTRAFDRAKREGDLLSEADPAKVARHFVASYCGVLLVSDPRAELATVGAAVEDMWYFILPSIVSADVLPFFKQFVARSAAQFKNSEAPSDEASESE